MALRINTAGFQKFLILIYKGWLIRKRHYIVCILFELLFPVILACVPAIIQSESSSGPSSHGSSHQPDWENATFYPSFDPLYSKPSYSSKKEILFAYTPANKLTDRLMENSIMLFSKYHNDTKLRNQSLENADDLESFCLRAQQDDVSLYVVATIFNNIFSNGDKLPSNLDYTIRHSGSSPDSSFGTDMKYRFSRERSNAYLKSYFLSWQASVEKTFINEKFSDEGRQPPDYEVVMQQFPYPKYKKQGDELNSSNVYSSMMLYAFLPFIMNLIRLVIEEKSNGSKELLKMMGMSNFIYWSSTFMNFFVIGALVMSIITIVFKVPLKYSMIILENSDFSLLLIIFLLFIANLILFCLAFTSFFNKAVYGVIMLVIVYIMCSSPLLTLVFEPELIRIKYLPLPLIAKLGICLFPPGALMTAFHLVTTLEIGGEGVRWYYLYSFDAVPDMNVSRVLLAMLFSCFLYSILIWYVDAVWPWQYGVPKPFYFLFTKSYWCGYQEGKTEEIFLGKEDDKKNSDFFEDEPTGISPGVVINNLSKVFRTGFQTKVAVKNLSLNMYNGQITALLGHNGAGKTTTINILTGLYTPSGGSASITGWNVFSQTLKARESLGVCPQHNVLYDTLTVEEHLKLYAALKGVSWKRLNEETQSMLNMLNLTPKKSELSKNLSGGMKRKLSLGIAVIGGSKVLFLDEPTSGMDVEARRSVWDALLEVRHNRTIILTTHYMEEADVLGDRIAIMAEGEIQCCGSSVFLKKKFGTGYHLHVVKEKKFNLPKFSNLVSKHAPGSSVENDYEREVSFNLASDTNASFAPLFEEIESNKENLGVNSCGITVTTMEDVFLKVSNVSDLKLQNEEALAIADETELKDIYMDSSRTGRSSSMQNQFYGLIMKRLHYSKRDWGILISQLILPFCILCCCLLIINSLTSQRMANFPPLKLDIRNVYGRTDGFFSWDSETASYADNIKEVLQNSGVNIQQVDSLNDSILNYAESSLVDYFKHLIVSGSVKMTNGKLNFTAWFNGAPYHAAPMSLLLMNSAILQSNFSTSYITLTNYPLPYIDRYGSPEGMNEMANKIIANIFVPLAFSFMASSFVLLPIRERATKAKLLQLMTGISAALYWIAMFIWDLAMSIIICILLIIPFAIFSRYVFFAPHSEAIGAALLMMILFAWASIPFSYLFSLVFLQPNTGFSVVAFISILAGVIVSSILMTLQEVIKLHTIGRFFLWFFKLLPSYALSSGFGNLFAVVYSNAFCESLDPKDLEFNCNPEYGMYYNPILKCCKDICGSECLNKTNPFIFSEGEGVSWDMVFLFFDGILYFILLLFFESSFISLVGRKISQQLTKLRRKIDYQFVGSTFVEDYDVLQEEERVRNNCMQITLNEALVVLNLSKIFKGRKAVDQLTFGIHKKECFGLLGVNGAGKTTTFRMLTGDCYPTEGNAFIGAMSVLTHLKEFQSHIGYCPQFDALIDKLSSRELITLFARLRGLSGRDLKRTVNALIKMTDLSKYADKPSMIYSGGNKRKLSIALALIGSPPLLLLDEPTAGVDPVSRRKIWKILSLARNCTDAAVILTTHSMEECEALCSRLAIMVNGRFRCLGSIQQLKTKFGQGYTLIIKMKKEEQSVPQSIDAIKVYIDTNLDGAELKDDHQGMLQYHIVDPSMTLSYLFKFMDDLKMQFNLEDFIVSDTSLEQIFLSFARTQRGVTEN